MTAGEHETRTSPHGGHPARPRKSEDANHQSPAGTYRWGRAFDLDQEYVAENGLRLAFDAAGNLVVAGGFTGAIDSGGGTRLESAARTSGFAAKLDATGAPLWTRGLGDGAQVSAVATDGDRTILAGCFNGALVLDGAVAQAGSDADLFLARTPGLCPEHHRVSQSVDQRERHVVDIIRKI